MPNPSRRIVARLAVALFAVLPALAAPPAPIPDTPAGRRFADVMALTDAGEWIGNSIAATQPGGRPGVVRKQVTACQPLKTA